MATTPIINILHESNRRSKQFRNGYMKFCHEYFVLGLKPKSACIEMFGKAHGRLNTGRIFLRWVFPVPVGGGAFIEATIYAHNEAGVGIEVPENASIKNTWIVWQWFVKSYQAAFKELEKHA